MLALLGFIELNTKIDNTKERILVFDMWQLLRGEEHNGIEEHNLLVFLLGVLNLYSPWLSRLSDKWKNNSSYTIEEKDEHCEKESIWGFGDAKKMGDFPCNSHEFCLNNQEVKRLHVYFYIFYQNYIRKQGKTKPKTARGSPNKNNAPDQNQNFKPKILAKSQKLAEKYRAKSIQKYATQIDRPLREENIPKETHDFLLMKGIEYKRNLDKYIDIKKNQEIGNCSFMPAINDRLSRKVNLQNLAKFCRYIYIYI